MARQPKLSFRVLRYDGQNPYRARMIISYLSPNSKKPYIDYASSFLPARPDYKSIRMFDKLAIEIKRIEA